MAKIHTLKISNYKGIKNFCQVFGIKDLVCIIGRGDSGKTSILEAISAVLSPSWNLSFYDTDFYNADITNQIEIEASLYDIPEKLLQESKFGLYIQGLDINTDIIYDEILDNHVSVLTIKLIVDKNLEPKWFVVNNRNGQEPIEIRASDRASLNVFLISDYIDRHFSWSKGNPLYSLLKEENIITEKTNVVIDAFREAKEKIDTYNFSHLDAVEKKLETAIEQIGVDIQNINTTIDFKDISNKDGRICLHETKIPFRLKGKGTKRLISIAIQMELAKNGGIILIDEIEQGLEPDRVKHLINLFKNNHDGQIFVTTHSRDVLVELDADNLFLMSKKGEMMYDFDSSYQGCLRSNPEAFFSKRVLVCEGATEVGICRFLDFFRIGNSKVSNSISAISLVDGTGSNFISYCQQFKAAGFDVCAFCDSDDKTINDKKNELTTNKIPIVDCDSDYSIEQQLFLDLSFESISKLVEYVVEEYGIDAVKSNLKNQDATINFDSWQTGDISKFRIAFGKSAKHKGWFKRIDHGEFLGAIWFNDTSISVKSKTSSKQFEKLNKWLDNA